MTIDFLKSNYSGKDVKVALIDTGVNDQIVSGNIRHYYVSNNKVVNDTISIIDDHGTICAMQILEQSPNAIIYDINLTINGELSEYDLITGIKFAVEQKVNIINISMGLEECSFDLYTVCVEASKNGILVIAANNPQKILTYPGDLTGVISILVSDKQQKDILVLNDKQVSIRKKEKFLSPNAKYLRSGYSTSLATAYFSGIMSLAKEALPLEYNMPVLLDKIGLYNVEKKSEKDTASSKEKIVIPSKSVVVVLSNPLCLERYKSIINKNIVGYYDFEINNFVDFENNLLDLDSIENIIIANASETKRCKIDKFDYYKKPIHYIGNFNDVFDNNLINFSNANGVKLVEWPVVSIFGFGCGCSKLLTQVEIYKGFKERGYNVAVSTFNAIGALFDFDVYKYPDSVKYPEIVYSINSSVNQNSGDIAIINVGGGISQISNHNKYLYGTLAEAYLYAVPSDIIILCINKSFTFQGVASQLLKFNISNKHVLIVASNIIYDQSSVEDSNGIIYYKSSHTSYLAYLNQVRKEISQYPVFSMDDVLNGKLTSYIFSLLTD